MTVKELIELLKVVQDQDRIVVMQKDAEGNGYSPLYCLSLGAYDAETTWYGEVGLEVLTAEDEARGYSHEDVVDGEPCIVLEPVN
jgi:hypothetical protein